MTSRYPNGVLAICYYNNNTNKTIQFTDLVIRQQVNVGVEDPSSAAFYDNFIVLTRDEYLREGDVDEVLKNPDTSILKTIGDISISRYRHLSSPQEKSVIVHRYRW